MKELNFLLAFLVFFFMTGYASADGLFYGHNSNQPILEPDQQAILLHDGENETILLRVSASGELSTFGWVIPLPSYPEVSELDPQIFDEIDKLTPPHYMIKIKASGTDSLVIAKNKHVTVDTQIIGNFEISRIKADDADALFNWLKKHEFVLPENSKPVMDDYIKRKFCFVAIKIISDKLQNAGNEDNKQEGWLDSLRIDFKSSDIFYPMKISSFNPGGTHLTLWIISEHRVKCNEGQTVWANWIDPEILSNSGCEFLLSEIDKQRFLTRIECEWVENKLIDDDIYLLEVSFDSSFPNQYWDSARKEYVRINKWPTRRRFF